MTQEKTINDIAVKVGRLEAMQESNTRAISDMAMSVNRLVDKLEKSDDTAKKALDRSNSSHHRIDEEKIRLDKTVLNFDGEIKDLNVRIDTENRERKSDKRWMIGTTLTAAGLIVAVIKLF